MLSFHVKFVQTDRWTTVKQYTPHLSMRGHKYHLGEFKAILESNFCHKTEMKLSAMGKC